MPRVLIIEDQEKLRRNLQQVLESEQYEVLAAATGEEGYAAATSQAIDAVILDITLPGRDGFTILADLRAAGFQAPILILTARDAVEDRVAGLDSGADDYLVKPFAHAELLARLRALLRRSQAALEYVLRCQDVEVDLVARRVVRQGVEIDLSHREFDLLKYLVKHKNTHVTREMLTRDVWMQPGGVLTNVIDVCINSLRKKIDLPGTTPLIHTIRGIGYTVRDE